MLLLPFLLPILLIRERAQSFSRGESGKEQDGRKRSNTFTQLQSKGYLERVKERRAEQGPMVPHLITVIHSNFCPN